MILEDIQLVVLDMAGTTVDDTFSVHTAMIKAFKDNGLEINREIASHVLAVPKPIGIQTILTSFFDINNSELVSKIHISFMDHMNFYYRESELVKETKDTTRLFLFLKERDIKIVLDTGFSKETADLIIDRLQWHSVIDGLVCSDDPSIGRPKPDMIYKAMELTGVDDSKFVVKVGDTPNDMLQGKNAKCKWTIGVNSGAFCNEDLINSGADLIVDYPYQIINSKIG
jgi:phosphonatase-like hydrolase